MRGFAMLIAVLSVSAGLAFFAFRLKNHYQDARAARILGNARESGVTVDANGAIDAGKSFASMSQKQAQVGEPFTGNKARFMELMRVVSEGPQTPEEIRFLIAEGIEPMVRPDGLVYVPCIENEHLSVEGELELKEEDLDRYIAQGHLQQMNM
jgi:hypothetical protein